MEDGIFNQINEVPIYHYDKLTVEMFEKAIGKVQKNQAELNKGNHFVLHLFGTKEQIEAYQERIDQAIIEELRNHYKR